VEGTIQVRAAQFAKAVVANAPNRVWAVDFQFDSTADGRPVKIVSIVDEHTRACLGGLVDRSITSDRLIDELDRLAQDRGYPAVLHCDNGPELTCAEMADSTECASLIWPNLEASGVLSN
jgi:transposase InsO family protein